MTCPEGAYRASLTDDEFWEHVYPEIFGIEEQFGADEVHTLTTGPCTQCGSTSACAYDAEGRPLIHAETGDDE